MGSIVHTCPMGSIVRARWASIRMSPTGEPRASSRGRIVRIAQRGSRGHSAYTTAVQPQGLMLLFA
eukprot:3778797-Prymnesium_polylepis.1